MSELIRMNSLNNKNFIYYVTEPCYNENSHLNLFKIQFLLIDISLGFI